MRIKSALLALPLSLLCLLPHASFADTLTLTSTSGGSTDGVATYPYQFTFVGSGGGVNTNVNMSCLNFDREITFGETWQVQEYSIPQGTGTLDGESYAAFRADAWLYNQYGKSTVQGVGAVTDSEIQFAIWSIMDSAINAGNSSYNGNGAFDATAQLLASMAIGDASTLSASYYKGMQVFIPVSTDSKDWTNGEPQIFMVNTSPSAETPEPSSLMLLGTGLMGTVGLMRRKLQPAKA